MAAGDRVQLFSLTEVSELSQQINDASTGLLTRVDQLETNPEPTLIEEYDQSKAYPAFYPIKRGSKLYVSKEATTGVFDELKWELIGRANTDDIIIEDGTGTATLKVVSGLPVLEVTDGSSTKQFSFKLSTGRIGLPNASTVEDAGDNDTLVKKDVPVTSDRFTWDDTEKRAKRVEDLPVSPANLVAGDTLYTEDVPLNRNTVEMVEGRPRLKAEPTATPSDDKDLLNVKDADERYIESDKPLASFDVDSDVNPGGFIPFTGSEIQINNGFTVQDGTDVTDKFLRIDKAGYYRVTASLLGYSAESQDNTAVTTGTPGSVVFNKGASASVAGVRYHQIRWYSNTDESYKNLHASVVIAVNQNEVLSFDVVGLGVYGSSGDYSAINVEYVRPL